VELIQALDIRPTLTVTRTEDDKYDSADNVDSTREKEHVLAATVNASTVHT